MKHFIIIFLLLSYSSYASDTLKDVEKAYQNALKKSIEEEKDEEEEQDYQKFIFIEQYKKQKQDQSFQLFHSIAAAISFIETNINQARYDEKNNYEWTKKNASFDVNKFSYECKKTLLFDNPLELSGNFYSGASVDLNYYFELERQRLLTDLFILKNITYFWYKTIFSFENVESYNHNLAVNLNPHIVFILKVNHSKMESISLFSDVSHTYYVIINDLLETILNNTPKDFSILLNKKNNVNSKNLYNKALLKTRNNAEVVNERLLQEYKAIFRLSHAIVEDICLLGNDFTNTLNDGLLLRLSNNYKKLIKCKLEIGNNCVNFKIHFNIYDLNKIKNKIYLIFHENDCEPVSYTNNITITENKKDPFNGFEIDSTTDKEIIENNEETESSNCYGPSYWKNLNKFHQERKNNEKILLNNDSNNNNNIDLKLREYDRSLFLFIKNNIYKYSRLSKRQFISELSKIKFIVEQNKDGNGSAYHISPAHDNPMFKDSDQLKNAFFSMHLPHKNNEIVNASYLEFAQSGFKHIFGLSREFIEHNLKIDNL